MMGCRSCKDTHDSFLSHSCILLARKMNFFCINSMMYAVYLLLPEGRVFSTVNPSVHVQTCGITGTRNNPCALLN